MFPSVSEGRQGPGPRGGRPFHDRHGTVSPPAPASAGPPRAPLPFVVTKRPDGWVVGARGACWSYGSGSSGRGSWARTTRSRCTRFVSGAEVVAARRPRPAAGRAPRREAAGPRAVDDPFALVASDEVDAVVVASPDATHPGAGPGLRRGGQAGALREAALADPRRVRGAPRRPRRSAPRWSRSASCAASTPATPTSGDDRRRRGRRPGDGAQHRSRRVVRARAPPRSRA